MLKGSSSADSAHAAKDRHYHDVIADEYHRTVVDPREVTNDALFKPLVSSVQPPDSYLDLGCGTGHMLERVCARLNPKRVTGVDHSEGMLAQIEQLPHVGAHESVQLIHDDILNFLQSSTEHFDLISCVGVLHHLKIETVEEVLSACHGKLRQGGHILVAEPVDAPTLRHPPAWVSRRNTRSRVVSFNYSKVVEEPDEYPLPEGLMEKILIRAGFKLVKQQRTVEVFPISYPPTAFDRAAAKLACVLYRKTGYVHAALAQPV